MLLMLILMEIDGGCNVEQNKKKKTAKITEKKAYAAFTPKCFNC